MNNLQHTLRNIVAVVVSSATLFPAAAFAQETTSTANAATTSAAQFNLNPGAQFVYAATGKLALDDNGERSETIDSVSTYTVLQKANNLYTILGETDVANPEEKAKYTPAGRFTFELPAEGAAKLRELETSGINSDAIPGITLEDVFMTLTPEGETTDTLPLPLTGAPAGMKSVTKKVGNNTVKTWQLEETTADSYSDTTSTFSHDKGVYTSIASKAKLEAPTPNGSKIQYSVDLKLELKNTSSVSSEELETLKKDIGMAIPITEKMMKMSMSDPGAFKGISNDIEAYLKEFPKGRYAQFLGDAVKQLKQVIGRMENWEKNKVGEAAQELTAKSVDGKEVKLADLKGKVVLIDFWATWCPPCVMEMPKIKELYEKNKDKGFEIIGVSADHELSDLTDFVKENDLKWPMVFEGPDPDEKSIVYKYGITSFPTMIIVGKDGKITHIFRGAGNDVEAAVAEALGEKK